jgi:hypothetical protein
MFQDLRFGDWAGADRIQARTSLIISAPMTLRSNARRISGLVAARSSATMLLAIAAMSNASACDVRGGIDRSRTGFGIQYHYR